MYYTNKDIRIAMIEADVTQVELAKRIGYTPRHLNRLLRQKHMNERTRSLMMQTISEIKTEHRAKAIEGAMTRKEVFVYLGSLPRVNKILDALCETEDTYFDKDVIDEYIDTHNEFDTVGITKTLSCAIIK